MLIRLVHLVILTLPPTLYDAVLRLLYNIPVEGVVTRHTHTLVIERTLRSKIDQRCGLVLITTPIYSALQVA